jgi:hypothetical protein
MRKGVSDALDDNVVSLHIVRSLRLSEIEVAAGNPELSQETEEVPLRVAYVPRMRLKQGAEQGGRVVGLSFRLDRCDRRQATFVEFPGAILIYGLDQRVAISEMVLCHIIVSLTGRQANLPQRHSM